MTPVAQALARRVAANVARLRRSAGWTLQALATRSGLHLRHVIKIERGETNVTLRTLVGVASAFAIDPAELFRPNRKVPRDTTAAEASRDTLSRVEALRARILAETGQRLSRGALMRALVRIGLDVAERERSLAACGWLANLCTRRAGPAPR